MPDIVTAPVVAPAPTAPAASAPAVPTTPAAPATSLPAAPKAPKVSPPLANKIEARRAADEAARKVFGPKASEEEVAGDKTATPATAVETKGLPASTGTTETPATPEATTTPATSPAATAGRRVEIDPRHPVLGGRKLEAITVQSEQEEQVLRGLLNSTGARRAELDMAKARVAELENERAEIQRQLISKETLETVRQEWEGTPQYQQALSKYNEIKANPLLGDEIAAQYWRGAQADFQRLAQSRISEKVSQAQAQDNDRRAQTWVNEMRSGLQDWLPEFVLTMPEISDWYDKAVRAFNAELELGNLPHVTNAETMKEAFKPFFQSRLAAQPKVHEVRNKAVQEQTRREQLVALEKAKSEKEREDLKKAAIDEYLKEQAGKRAANPPHPLGQLAAASRNTNTVVSGDGSETASPPTRVQSPHQAKQNARQAARELARQRFGGA